MEKVEIEYEVKTGSMEKTLPEYAGKLAEKLAEKQEKASAGAEEGR